MISKLSTYMVASVAFLPVAAAAADPGIATPPRPDAVQALRATPVTTRVSVATDGTDADALSMDAAIAAGGRYVAFVSAARTWWPATPTTGATCSCGTGGSGDRACVGRLGRRPGQRPQHNAGDLRGRTLCGVHVERPQPGGRRHQRQARRVRAGHGNRVTRRVRRPGRRPGQRPQQPAVHLRGRPLRGFRVRTRPTWWPATPTARMTCSCGTRWPAVTRRVSRRPARCPEPTEDSLNPSISADGRYVAFISRAATWSPATPTTADVFVRDMVNRHVTRRVSVGRARRAGQRPQPCAVDLRGRPVRGVRFGRVEPGGRRHPARTTCSCGTR